MSEPTFVTKQAYSINDFCEAFSIPRTTVYELIAAGRLPIKKFGRRTLIRAEDAKAWLDALPNGRLKAYPARQV